MTQENYIVSALKYRPSSWGSLVGQNNISSTLLHAIETLPLIYTLNNVDKKTKSRIINIFKRYNEDPSYQPKYTTRSSK